MKRAITIGVLILITAQLFSQTTLSSLNFNNPQNQRAETPMAQQLLHEHFRPMLHYPLLPPVPNNESLIATTKERLDSIVLQSNIGVWIPAQKIYFTWNAQNLVVKQENFEFDDVLMQMVPSSRESYDYNSNGEMTERVYERYDVSINQWIGDYKMAYTWSNGQLATSASWYWDGFLNQWVSGSRGTYHYLTNGLLDYAIFEYWDDFTSQWNIGYKQEITYNTVNLMVIDLYSFYDPSQQQYFPGSKDEYTYHTNGKVSKVESAFYDTFLMIWTPERRTEFTYDTNANATLEVASYYSPFDSIWVFTYKQERTFDALNNMTSEVYYYYDEMLTVWEADNKTDYNYDNSAPYASLLVPNTFLEDDPEVVFRHKITKLDGYLYDNTMLTWLHNMKGDLFWSTVTIGVEQPALADMINVLPNPATEFLTISGDQHNVSFELKLTDLRGRTVLKQSVMAGEKIQISHLKPGMYLYQIHLGAQLVRKNKILIAR